MTRQEVVRHIVLQARSNGFDFRGWYRAYAAPEWLGFDEAIDHLCQGRNCYALLFSHEFAQAFWKAGLQMSFMVPAVSYPQRRKDGQIVTIQFGIPGVGNSIPAPGDYSGSGHVELAAYLTGQGELAYGPSDGGPSVIVPFGLTGLGQTLPAPGDYDGSGQTNVAAYFPSSGLLAYLPKGGGNTVFVTIGTPDQTIPFALNSATFEGGTSASAESLIPANNTDWLSTGTPASTNLPKAAATGSSISCEWLAWTTMIGARRVPRSQSSSVSFTREGIMIGSRV